MKKKMIIMMLLALCSCQSSVMVPNPNVTYGRLEDAEKAIGFNLTISTNIIGLYKLITVINKEIIEVKCENYCIRKKKLIFEDGIADISGVYISYQDQSIETIEDIDVRIKGNDNIVNVAMWKNESYLYSIYSKDGFEIDLLNILIKNIK